MVVEDIALALRASSLLVERNLVADTPFDVLGDVEMALHSDLGIEIVPDTAFCTQSYVVEGLFSTSSVHS